MVKKIAICDSSATWYGFCLFVNAFVHCWMIIVSSVCLHKITRVFQSPWRRTLSFSRDHHDCFSHGNIANSAGSIVSMNCGKWSFEGLILCPVNVVSTLNSGLIAEVVWIIRHAEMVSCSSMIKIPAASNPPHIHQLSSWDIWAAWFSPPCVNYSTTPWARGTLRACCSSLSPLSLWPVGTRHSILSIPSISPLQYLNERWGAIVDTLHSIPCGDTSLWSLQSSSCKELSHMHWKDECGICTILVYLQSVNSQNTNISTSILDEWHSYMHCNAFQLIAINTP